MACHVSPDVPDIVWAAVVVDGYVARRHDRPMTPEDLLCRACGVWLRAWYFTRAGLQVAPFCACCAANLSYATEDRAA